MELRKVMCFGMNYMRFRSKTYILGLDISPQVDPLSLLIDFHDNTFNVKGQKTKEWKLRGRTEYRMSFF